MLLHRLLRRATPILIVYLLGVITSNAAAAHIPGTAQLGGWVYIDRNNDGHLAFSNEPNPEYVIGDVSIDLLSKVGTVETPFASMLTDPYGRYFFDNLPPGTYVLRETQPIQFVDGIDTLGQLFGLINPILPPGASAGTAANNAFVDIVLPADVLGDFYNFGERGLAAGFVSKRFLLALPPTLNTAPEPAAALLVLAAISGILSSRPSRRN